MTFRKGHSNTHDVAAAGRKGKNNSPWRHRMLHTPNARRAEREYQQRLAMEKGSTDSANGGETHG